MGDYQSRGKGGILSAESSCNCLNQPGSRFIDREERLVLKATDAVESVKLKAR